VQSPYLAIPPGYGNPRELGNLGNNRMICHPGPVSVHLLSGAGEFVIRGRFICYPGPVGLSAGTGLSVIRDRIVCHPGPEIRRNSLLHKELFSGNSITYQPRKKQQPRASIVVAGL